jgi:membrane protease YdiL (CAAX protease family)
LVVNVVLVVLRVLRSVSSSLGEEIGWRGFLVPELAKFTSFTTTAVISGVIWAVWHYPAAPTVYAGWATPTWYWMSGFTIAAIAISFALTWFRLVSGSLWPCVFLHASHNVFMRSVFMPLTYDTGITKYIAGDLGAGFAVVALVVAFISGESARKRKRRSSAPVHIAGAPISRPA